MTSDIASDYLEAIFRSIHNVEDALKVEELIERLSKYLEN